MKSTTLLGRPVFDLMFLVRRIDAGCLVRYFQNECLGYLPSDQTAPSGRGMYNSCSGELQAAGAEQLWSDASLKYLVAHHFDANLEGDPVEYQVGHMAEVAEKRPRTEQESQPGF